MIRRHLNLLPTLLLNASMIASTLSMGACANDPRSSYVEPPGLTTKDEAAFGGEALSQRKLELERARADLSDFLETLITMKDRNDEESIETYRGFLDRYLLSHIEPLLRAEWQSNHPELIAYDANLRFIHGEILIELAYTGWARDAINEISHRYKQRGNMLIEYPIGNQTTLREALAELRERGWLS